MERRLTKKKPELKRVSYRIPLHIEEAIVALAQAEGTAINTMVTRLLTLAVSHHTCQTCGLPCLGEIRTSL